MHDVNDVSSALSSWHRAIRRSADGHLLADHEYTRLEAPSAEFEAAGAVVQRFPSPRPEGFRTAMAAAEGAEGPSRA